MNITSGRMDQRATAAALDWGTIYKYRPLLTLDEALGRRMPLYRKLLSIRDPDYDFVYDRRFGADEYRRIMLPALHVTGWFDLAQAGAMEFWNGMTANSPAKDQQYLLIGPWDHLQTLFGGEQRMREMEFTPDSQVDIIALHARFFDQYLKGISAAFDFPRARVYVTGSNRWRDLDSYPPVQSREQRLYLHSGGQANSLRGDGALQGPFRNLQQRLPRSISQPKYRQSHRDRYGMEGCSSNHSPRQRISFCRDPSCVSGGERVNWEIDQSTMIDGR